ncbi:MAG: potassium transporter Kup [Gemmatimonas sp.]
MPATNATTTEVKKQSTGALALGALGVVYGDIGTSPLYTMHEIFGPSTGVPLDPSNIVGAVSTIFWLLMFVVTLKYVMLILRADNRGEGGIMALVALAAASAGRTPQRKALLLSIGVFGAALFYGDSVITPAISVLGAMEGLEVAVPSFEAYVLPISVAILVGLFLFQRHGTATVGRWFGPIIVVWFAVLGVAGAVQIVRAPDILAAVNPVHAMGFLAGRGWGMFAALGAVVLAITGAEALYADLGHFGRRPIQIAWVGLVLPALALNYFGQGALLIADPAALQNPFYRLFPDAWLLPALCLATAATVIASQAVISGTYSMTRQAIQLGFLPRMRVVYTSAQEMGQIYMPVVNWTLLVAVLMATLGFGSSSALASAYGIAVTMTMFITTLLTFFVVLYGWRYPLWIALAATGTLLTVDALLVAACSVKFVEGGWFPIALGIALFCAMATWKRGRELLLAHMRRDDPQLEPFVERLLAGSAPRIPRTGVFFVANPGNVPQALLHNLKHNMVIHDRLIVLTVLFHDVPWIPYEERVDVCTIAKGVWRVTVNYGFKNVPDIPQALELCKQHHGLDINLFATSYFLSRETLVPSTGGAMAWWREQLFAAMSRNAGSVVEFFRIPHNSVIELGTRVQI